MPYNIRVTENGVRIMNAGSLTTYNKGDWVSVGRQTALSLVSDKKAEMHDLNDLYADDDIAVIVGDRAIGDMVLYQPFPKYPLDNDDLQADKNVIVDSAYHYRSFAPSIIGNPAQLAIGLGHLDTVDVVFILNSFENTVQDSGYELEQTKQIVLDARILAYQSCVFLVRNSKNGRAFYHAWLDEMQNGKMHALLRAQFLTRPTVQYLPPHWGFTNG